MSFVPPFSDSVRRGATALAAAGALTVSVGTPFAAAHDAVVGGSPEDGAVVNEFPDTLRLTFSGYPQEGFNTFALSNTDTGDVVFSGEPELDGRDLVLDLPDDIDAQPGNYRIGFQIISSDGHSTKGMTTFSYEPEGGAADNAGAQQEGSSDAKAEDADGNGSGLTPWLLAGAGALVVAAAAIAVVAKRNRAAHEAAVRTSENADADRTA